MYLQNGVLWKKPQNKKNNSTLISVILSQDLYATWNKGSSCTEEFFKRVVLKFSEISSENSIGGALKANFQYQKLTPPTVFSYGFSKIFRTANLLNTYEELLRILWKYDDIRWDSRSRRPDVFLWTSVWIFFVIFLDRSVVDSNFNKIEW